MNKKEIKLDAKFCKVMDNLDSDKDYQTVIDYVDWSCKKAYEKGILMDAENCNCDKCKKVVEIIKNKFNK